MPLAAINSDRGEYRLLAQQIRDAGLMERRRWYYGLKIGGTLAVMVAGWALLFVVGSSPVALAVAAFWAIAFTQVVFLGHDAGHQQIFGTPRANRVIGLGVGNLCTGLSFGWWVPKHNAHHAHPNQIGRDPDIGAGVIAFTEEAARSRRGAARLLVRWQAWLFFPLLLLEGVGLHAASVRGVLTRRGRAAGVEKLLLAVHTVAYFGVVFWVLSPLWAVAFIAVHQGLFGLYLGCTFAPNHKGMPLIERDSSMSFARRQVLTARNVTGGRITTFMLGGLNYQIEHHLFPAMPRPNLARAQTLVRPFCGEHGLSYEQDTLVGSYRQALRHLAEVGANAAPSSLSDLVAAAGMPAD
jgi:fatty acid desaturase